MWLLHKKESIPMKDYQIQKREVYDEFANIEKTYYFVRERYCPLLTNRFTGEKFVYPQPCTWEDHGKYVFSTGHYSFSLTEFKTTQEALDYIERLKSGAVYNNSVDTLMETVS